MYKIRKKETFLLLIIILRVTYTHPQETKTFDLGIPQLCQLATFYILSSLGKTCETVHAVLLKFKDREIHLPVIFLFSSFFISATIWRWGGTSKSNGSHQSALSLLTLRTLSERGRGSGKGRGRVKVRWTDGLLLDSLHTWISWTLYNSVYFLKK